MVKFYQGGLDYFKARKMGLNSLMTVKRHAAKINKAIKDKNKDGA